MKIIDAHKKSYMKEVVAMNDNWGSNMAISEGFRDALGIIDTRKKVVHERE